LSSVNVYCVEPGQKFVVDAAIDCNERRQLISRAIGIRAPPWKNTVAMEYDYDTVNGLGADECYLIGGDRGGPSFIDVNGQLSLVGIHYYNGARSTIDVEGTQTISAPVVMQNDVTISGDGTLSLSGGITGAGHALTVFSDLTASSIRVDSLVIGGSGAVQAVPEPGSLAMLVSIAAGGAILWRRRRC
jgi:hypothetical protein